MEMTVHRVPRRSFFFVTGFAAWILLVVAGAPIAYAQGIHVEGVVRDPSGGSVPSAQVKLRAKAFSATTSTDALGAFAFEHVQEPSGTISVTAKGFQQVDKERAAFSGNTAHLGIVLTLLEVNQRLIVTATRTETLLTDVPMTNIQLSREESQSTPALTLDDKLRQVPGFGLFRCSSSRTANPTTQGVSLRELGASGSSRARVLEDGIPLNDPFGGWAYWDRVPRESVANIEIAPEGASSLSLYGSNALGGIIQFLTRRAEPAGISVQTSCGNQNSPELSLWAGGQMGRWESAFGSEVSHTDGYILVHKANRGSVDTRAGSDHRTADAMIRRKIGEQSEIFARGWYFDESRENGTPLQTNGTRLAQKVILWC